MLLKWGNTQILKDFFSENSEKVDHITSKSIINNSLDIFKVRSKDKHVLILLVNLQFTSCWRDHKNKKPKLRKIPIMFILSLKGNTFCCIFLKPGINSNCSSTHPKYVKKYCAQGLYLPLGAEVKWRILYLHSTNTHTRKFRTLKLLIETSYRINSHLQYNRVCVEIMSGF